jgi:competence protein ComEA
MEAAELGFDLKKFLVVNKVQVGIGLVGVILMGWGVVAAMSQIKRDAGVEIVSKSNEPFGDAQGKQDAMSNEIIVDVGGAVEKPGVYRLDGEARINDALVAAGGLSAEADRSWVTRFVNLAAKLEDGMKIYVPSQSEGMTSSTGGAVAGSTVDNGSVVAPGSGVNINTASASELDALWGIGEKRAADIIANRPYSNIDELMTKAGIPKNVFERIEGQITVY